jgi:uncharacterized membrane protein
MNIHPIFVHFPIALLTVYAVLELVRFKKISEKAYWFYTKAVLVVLGTLGACAALLTGDAAKDAIRNGGQFQPLVDNFREVVSMHETFADLSLIIFSLVSLSYIILWLKRENCFSWFSSQKIQNFLEWIAGLAHFFVETPFGIILALVGLVLITITGGLGGIMVYGKDADPIFGFVYKLLFPN